MSSTNLINLPFQFGWKRRYFSGLLRNNFESLRRSVVGSKSNHFTSTHYVVFKGKKLYFRIKILGKNIFETELFGNSAVQTLITLKRIVCEVVDLFWTGLKSFWENFFWTLCYLKMFAFLIKLSFKQRKKHFTTKNLVINRDYLLKCYAKFKAMLTSSINPEELVRDAVISWSISEIELLGFWGFNPVNKKYTVLSN